MNDGSLGVSMQVPDRASLRRILGTFPTGVTVVTTRLAGEPYGMTANSFTSVSLDPPLTLVCLRRGARVVTAITRERAFGINILGHSQEQVARYFADPRRPAAKYGFDIDECRVSESGIPYVRGALVYLECSLYAMYPGGDHVLCVGEVVGTYHAPGTPLAFVTGQFHTALPSC